MHFIGSIYYDLLFTKYNEEDDLLWKNRAISCVGDCDGDADEGCGVCSTLCCAVYSV